MATRASAHHSLLPQPMKLHSSAPLGIEGPLAWLEAFGPERAISGARAGRSTRRERWCMGRLQRLRVLHLSGFMLLSARRVRFVAATAPPSATSLVAASECGAEPEPGRRRSRSVLFLALLLSSSWPSTGSATGGAGEPSAAATKTPAPPAIAEVEADLASLKADSRLDEAIKAVLRREYEQALDALRAAAAFAEQARAYREAIQSGPQRVESLSRQVRDGDVTEREDVDRSKPTSALQAELEARRIGLSTLEQKRVEVERDLETLRRRPVEIAERSSELEKQLAEVKARLDASEAIEDAATPSAAARQTLLRARFAKATRELEMLEAEQQSQAIREELLQAELRLLKLRVARSVAGVSELQEVVAERLASTAERIRAAAEAVPGLLVRTSSEAAIGVEETRALADELDEVVAARSRVDRAQEEVRERLKALTADFENFRAQLALGLGGRSLVQLAFDLNRRCSLGPRALEQLPVPGLEETQVAALRLRERLRLPEEREIPPSSPPELDELVSAHRAGLKELQRQYAALIRALAAFEREKLKYQDEAEEIRDDIAQQLFGFGLKSSPALSLETFQALPAALTWLAAKNRDLRLLLNFAVTERLGWSLALMLGFALSLGLRPACIRVLRGTSARLRQASTDRMAHTVLALMITGLLAVPIPLVLGALRWGIGESSIASDWLWAFGAALGRGAVLVFAAAFVSAALRPDGIAVAHFKWHPERARQLRDVVRWVAWVYVPAIIVTISCSFGEASAYFDSLGRSAFVVAHLWTASVLVRMLLAKTPDRAGSQDRLRITVPAIMLVTACLVLFGLAVWGYLITALTVSLGLVASLGLVLVASILHGLTLRWFMVRRRSFELRERLEQTRARRSAPGEDSSSEPDRALPIDESEGELDLGTVTHQIRSLLGSLFSVATLVAVAGFWYAAFPVVDLAGSATIPFLGGLTVLQVAQVGLIVLVTVTLVRNLPGLLELTIFRPTGIIPGTRFAISTLGQYAVIAIGATYALGIIEVDWAQFGWIAAGLSVGLGFGMQEIVANFISGLIILFERPIRVGDIVTVEGTTGTVTKIHMRSTTVVNWDRQEFVVPNKTLVTSTLLNWTLSTSVNRIVIPVGIAYGSDVDRALQTLLEVARNHPKVLDEPKPLATFESFADSSLSLILRAYLPDIDSRLATITELHAQIHRRFAAAGIEIAFPQRDLHLRSGWTDRPDGGRRETLPDVQPTPSVADGDAPA